MTAHTILADELALVGRDASTELLLTTYTTEEEAFTTNPSF